MIKKIDIGGEKRPVRFSINALMEFEDITGIDITDPEGRIQMIKMKNIRALAFVGLKHGFKIEHKADPSFTIEDVGDWLDTQSKDSILDVFSGESSGDEEETKEDEKSKKKLDGDNSGQ